MEGKNFIGKSLLKNANDFATPGRNGVEFELTAIVAAADQEKRDYNFTVDAHLAIKGLVDLHRL